MSNPRAAQSASPGLVATALILAIIVVAGRVWQHFGTSPLTFLLGAIGGATVGLLAFALLNAARGNE